LQMRMSKKTRIAGVRTRSVGKNSGRLHVSGCGTCASRLNKRCNKLSSARLSGHPRKRPSLCSSPLKSQLRSMGLGSGLQHSDELLGASGLMLHFTEGWKAPLSSRGKPVVERSSSRECLYKSVLSIWPTRPTVSVVLFGSSA
jgi:hypothetical protein